MSNLSKKLASLKKRYIGVVELSKVQTKSYIKEDTVCTPDDIDNHNYETQVNMTRILNNIDEEEWIGFALEYADGTLSRVVHNAEELETLIDETLA